MRIFAEWNNDRMKFEAEQYNVIDLLLFVGNVLKNGAEAVEFLTPEQVAKMALKAFETNKESSTTAARVIFLSELNELREAYQGGNRAEEVDD